MAVIRRDAIIGASADAVFRIVEDPANWPRYVPHVSRALDIHQSEPRIGDTFRLLYGFLGISVDEKLTVTEYEAARVYTMRVDGHMSGTQHWTFEPRDSQPHQGHR